IYCSEDHVWRQACRQRRHGVRLRQRERGRARPRRARRGHSAVPIAKKAGITRQTPRVSIAVRRTALVKRPVGRSELRCFTDWNDGQPETELNFKFYRQATNKIVGISEEAAAFLDGFF